MVNRNGEVSESRVLIHSTVILEFCQQMNGTEWFDKRSTEKMSPTLFPIKGEGKGGAS